MSERLKQWLATELNRLNWSHAELAAKAGVSRALVSRTLRGDMPASADFCIKVALALDDVAPEYLLRLAGILPGEPTQITPGPITLELLAIVETLPPELRQQVLSYAKFIAGQQQS